MKATHSPLEHVKQCFNLASAKDNPEQFCIVYDEHSDALYCVYTPSSCFVNMPRMVMGNNNPIYITETNRNELQKVKNWLAENGIQSQSEWDVNWGTINVHREIDTINSVIRQNDNDKRKYRFVFDEATHRLMLEYQKNENSSECKILYVIECFDYLLHSVVRNFKQLLIKNDIPYPVEWDNEKCFQSLGLQTLEKPFEEIGRALYQANHDSDIEVFAIKYNGTHNLHYWYAGNGKGRVSLPLLNVHKTPYRELHRLKLWLEKNHVRCDFIWDNDWGYNDRK